LCPALQKIGFQLGESGEHLGVDVEHRAANAGVFVLAVCVDAGAEGDANECG
jgi:hypothetical protein